MKPRLPCRAILLATAALALVSCGLKGSLTLPSQSDEVVIRGAGQTAPASATPEADAAPVDPAATPAESSTEPAPRKAPRKDTRIPPPPLPGGNPGTARGG